MAREVDLGLVVGAQGPKGDKGDPGKDGTGVNIKGSVTDETNLPGTGTSGDAYLDNSGNLWVYVGSGGDSTNGLFKNAGNIKGPKGDQGEKGDTGEQGPKGETGQAGADGEDGITPTIGENGNWFLGASDTGKPSRGLQGPKGDTGDQGPAGQDGEVGPQGPKGDKGDTGAQGPAGKDGQTPTFSIDENGHLIASFEE